MLAGATALPLPANRLPGRGPEGRLEGGISWLAGTVGSEGRAPRDWELSRVAQVASTHSRHPQGAEILAKQPKAGSVGVRTFHFTIMDGKATLVNQISPGCDII